MLGLGDPILWIRQRASAVRLIMGRINGNSEEAVTLSELLIILLFLVSILITVSSLDDAFIDLLALGIMCFRVPDLVEHAHAIPKIAVFVANWHEEDVLGKMVEGNLARIPAPEVSFFLGVYPNDT